MGDELRSVQALRAAAATAVVAHHAFRATTVLIVPPIGSIEPPGWLIQLGAMGVDVFFILSGFLMAYISRPYFQREKPASLFLIQRVLRIWPPYALATCIACIEIFVHHHAGWQFDFQSYRLASFVFLPSFNVNGVLQPIVGPGWTLNYEAMFYISFALVICLGPNRPLLKLAAILITVFLIGQFSPQDVVHSFLGDPIIFEFLIGAGIGFAMKAGRFNPSHGWVWIAVAALLLAAFGFCGLGVKTRLVAYGLPSAALCIGFLGLERRVKWPGVLILLGDASYSIYLVHTLVIYGVIKVERFQHLHFGRYAAAAASLAGFTVAILTGLGFFWLVERPLLRACHALLRFMTKNRVARPLVAS